MLFFNPSTIFEYISSSLIMTQCARYLISQTRVTISLMSKEKKGIALYKAISNRENTIEKNTQFSGLSQDIDKGISNKAARLLLLLGKDGAAKIMAKLAPHEVEKLAKQIAGINRVNTGEAKALLEEFGRQFGEIEIKRTHGGIDAARQILISAFGKEQAEEILAKSVPEIRPVPFSFLNDLTVTQLISLLQKENPRTLSLVMTYIDPYLSSRLLKSLKDEDRAEVIRRMAQIREIPRDVLATMEETLKKKIRGLAAEENEALDGKAVLADMLRYMDVEDENRILAELDRSNPEISEQIKMKLYTMDLVLELRDRDLQSILQELTERDIALLLKGQTEEIRDKIRDSLSNRRRLLVDEEIDILPPVPKSEVDRVSREFLNKMRKGEQDGVYVIMRAAEEHI